jgi:hypothetical protein
MSAVDRQVIAKVKSIEGEVIAIALDGSKRILMVGDFIYSDEIIDTSNGKIFLFQDGDIVLQKDIAAIFSQENLSPEEKSNIDKILKELESEEASLLAKHSKEKLAALASGEAGQDKHEAPFIVSHEQGEGVGVHAQAQVFVSFEPMPLPENNIYTPPIITIPKTGISDSGEVTPIELRATTLNQLDITQLSFHSVGEFFGVLAENHNIVKQDIRDSYDILMQSHPDAVLAITVTGDLADYNAAPLEFPAPIILPFGLGMQPWSVIAGDTPNTVSFLYRKADLNLLNTVNSDSKQSLIDFANQHLELIHDLRNTIEQQISGISSLSLDQFEIKTNLDAKFGIFEELRVHLQQEIGLLSSQKIIADSNLATWGSTMHNFGIPLGTVSNNAAIAAFEANWKVLGGTPETMPSVLEGLYANQAVYQHAVNLLAVEILAKQNILTALVHDIIGPILDLSSFNPVGDADYKQVLSQASAELSKLDVMAQGYKNALLNSLEGYDLVLRTGLTNDADFGFKTQVLLVNNTSNLTLNPIMLAELFAQNGGLVNVDALASGLKVDLNGHLTSDQLLSVKSNFDVKNTEIELHLKLSFANPSADENIHIEIPGIPGLTWNSIPPPVLPLGWILHTDTNSLTLDLPAVAHSSRASIDHILILNFPTALLKNIDLSQAVFKVIVNSQVIPTGDHESDLSNNTLNQEFGFDLVGNFPARGLYMVESVSQNDAINNPTKHVAIDIKPLLENIAVYVDLLSGAALTNFLNNTKIEFKFFNVDPTEPPKVLLSDGVPHPGIDFVKVGDSWILTGQSLKSYVDLWISADSSGKDFYEHPLIIAAPYGADDMSVTVFGLINGATQVVVQPLVPIVIDAVAQGITGGGVADFVINSQSITSNDIKFNLTVNIASANGDGTENKLIDINLTEKFGQYLPLEGWTASVSNNPGWSIQTVGTDVHLIGNLLNQPGNFSSQLTLDFYPDSGFFANNWSDFQFSNQLRAEIILAPNLEPGTGNISYSNVILNGGVYQMQIVFEETLLTSRDNVKIDLTNVFGDHLPSNFNPQWGISYSNDTSIFGDEHDIWQFVVENGKTYLQGTNLNDSLDYDSTITLFFSVAAFNYFKAQNGLNYTALSTALEGINEPIISAGNFNNVDLSNVHFSSDHTIFNLKVNLLGADSDGSEARLIDINLSNVFHFDPARVVPEGLDPNWQVFSNNSVWHIEIINGEPHLLGNLQGVPGTTSSQLELGFNSALLQYLPKNANGKYEIVIGGPSFNQQGENPAGVISKEILGPNEQDFNLSNDTAGPTYLAAGTSVEVPAATALLKEAQVGGEDLTPGLDAFRIDISAALEHFIQDLGVGDLQAYTTGSNITLFENGIALPAFTLSGLNLYNRVTDYYNAATPAEKAEIGSFLYSLGQYNTGTSQILVDYDLFPNNAPNQGGLILPATTVIFDAVGSGTEVPVFTSNGFTAGSIPTISVLGLDLNITARDISSETVVITIHLPHAPDASVLAANAPAGLVFGWQLDPGSSGFGSPWSLNGDTLTGTFNLATLNTVNIASSLALDFNNTVLSYLNPNVVGNNIIDFTYAVHSTDSSSPSNYITSDNQSLDLTGAFEVILTKNENIISSENVIGSFPEIYLGNLPDVPNADINLGDGAFDFNAANVARMSTMLHVTIDFADPDPSLTRTVAVFLPKTGDNASADIQQRFLDWKLLAGVENGWSIDTSYNSSTEIKLVKTFAGGSESLSTGNIDDYVPVSFLLTGVGSFDQRTLTSSGPSPIVPQEMGLHVQVSTTSVVDIGGGQTAIQVTSSPVIATSQDIAVPPFVMTDDHAPVFTSGNDYYYIENPGAGLSSSDSGGTTSTPQPAITTTRNYDPVLLLPKQLAVVQITGLINGIKNGTSTNPSVDIASIDLLLLVHFNIDIPANTDYSSLLLTLTSLPSVTTTSFSYLTFSQTFPPIPTLVTVNPTVNITPTYTLEMAQADMALVNSASGDNYSFLIFLALNQNNAVYNAMGRLVPSIGSDLNGQESFYQTLSPITMSTVYNQQITYSYSIFSEDVVSEFGLGIGHIFNPDAGDDTIIGSHGRDVFNAGQNSFITATTGGEATNTESTITFGNEVFVGGLGRDWIESGAGSDVAYSDGTPFLVSIPADIGPAYAPIFLTTGLIDSSGNVLGIFLPKVTDVIATGSGNDIIYTGGANYDSYISAYPGNTVNNVPSQFVGGVDDGVSDKSAGVLVFAGPGDNIIFSGKGADVIILDDTIGITRVVPTDAGGELSLTVSMSQLSGLKYVYNATDANGDVIAHGDYNDMFTDNTLNTVQSLVSSGQISHEPGNPNLLVSYLYDVIRPIYDSSYDTKLSYTFDNSPLTQEAINAEHGSNTLVYWKDSVSTDPNSADIVMYFDVTKDKINLTGLFNELAPNMTDAQRFAAIHWTTPITSVSPYDVTAETEGGTNVGMEGVRITVTIGANQYQIADLANVHVQDISSNIFQVNQAPDIS